MNHDDFLEPHAQGPQRPLTVSELTGQVKDLLEGAFPQVWVTGEISNCARPRSGHCYLTLKDDQSQLPAVIWRPTMARLRFELHDGLEVICRGNLGVYPPQGKYQLIVQEIQPKGIGALELALRQLREKLAREGLFDPARKRPLPRFARKIAVVTSPSGAAIRDFLEVLRRRWRGTDVLIVPVRVQGEGAGEEIAAAIDQVNRLRATIDCLVVTRGGGSLEDLWAFNEEIVCRAIYHSRIPVVSAIGHEIDVTLSDLVADVRALTPSEAAERVAPAAEEIAAQLAHFGRRLLGTLRAAGRVSSKPGGPGRPSRLPPALRAGAVGGPSAGRAASGGGPGGRQPGVARPGDDRLACRPAGVAQSPGRARPRLQSHPPHRRRTGDPRRAGAIRRRSAADPLRPGRNRQQGGRDLRRPVSGPEGGLILVHHVAMPRMAS